MFGTEYFIYLFNYSLYRPLLLPYTDVHNSSLSSGCHHLRALYLMS